MYTQCPQSVSRQADRWHLAPCFLCGSNVRPTLSSPAGPRADRKTRQITFRSGSSGTMEAAIGLRVRTGYATAVLLGGPTASPRVLARVRVSLVDLDDEDARQPYHVVSEQDEKRGMRLVRQTRDTATDAWGKAVGPPWGAQQKAAALAAWVALTGR